MKHIIFFAVLFAATLAFPKPAGFVSDFAGLLTDASPLEYALGEYEKNTTVEIALVTIEALPSEHTAATYSVELFQEWGIGKRGEDNGILILIVKNGTVGNRLRIELGYGIQGYVTGAEAGRILDEVLPYYQQGDYQKSAEIIISRIQEHLTSYRNGTAAKRYEPSIEELFSMLPFLILLLFFVVSGIEKCPYCKSRKIECKDDKCTCKKCGHRFKKKKSAPVFIVGGFGGRGGSPGGGSSGGGSSGGGGAGR